MPIAIWNDRYATGVQIVDDQHRQLFGVINELHDAFHSGKSTEELQKVMDFLVTYTLNHFQTEENFMKEMGYPDLQRHQTEHAVLTRKVQELRTKFLTCTPPGVIEIAKFLGDWLTHHIGEVDMGYIAFLKAKGGK